MNVTGSSSDIAIVGMSALFPGAKNLEAYWENILGKVNAIQEAPDEWALPYFDPDSQDNDRIYTRKGGFLGELAEFDPIEFGIMPASVDGGEPDHFLALRLSMEALQDAGYGDRRFNRERTGIILGRGTYINRGYNTLLQHGQIVDQTLSLLQQLNPSLDPETLSQIRQQLKASLPPFTAEMVPGLVPNVITGRIANRLDLMGPNYIVDAACASSLIAVELAMKELVEGRCDMMLAGGVHASTPPQINMIFCRIGALARDTIRPFDQRTTGTLLGEGMGILVLKRLADAQADGDRIYAVLKGLGSSSDGKAYGLLAPRSEGEVLALERAYHNSGVSPATVGLIEAHGTGIPLGDQTEIKSLSKLFGQRQGDLPSCALGSVKSMIGHCIPAAGAAGLIKVALALYHKILPPTLCEQVNPALEIEQTPFYLNTEPRPWIHGDRHTPRRAGVNAFGFGGINAHAVLEEYPASSPDPLVHNHWPTELLVFAAAERAELTALLQQVLQVVQVNPQVALADLAYTLSQRSLSGSHRLALTATDLTELQTKLTQAIDKLQEDRPRFQTRNGIYYAAPEGVSTGKIAFLFPGEGSQYPNMLADLCLYFPVVRSWFDRLDATFFGLRDDVPSQLIFPAPTSLTPEVRQQLESRLFSMDLASETVFTASMALFSLLQEFGIQPDAMVGHSTGEFAALIAAGVVRLKDDTDLMEKIRHLNGIYGQLAASDRIPKGSLVTVGGVDRATVSQLLERFAGQLHFAMDNCPNQAVLFGPPTEMEQVVNELKAAGGICTPLPFDRAYHTSLFEGVGTAFRAYYDSLEVGPAAVPLYSCAIAAAFPDDPEGIRTLATQQWSQRVRFRETIEKLYSEGVTTFIEVGPRSNLTAFVKDVLQRRPSILLASNQHNQTGLEQIQHLLARLWTNQQKVDLSALFRQRSLAQLDLEAAAITVLPHKQRPVLALTMPTLRLQPKFVQQIQQQLAPPATVAPPQPQTNGATSPSAVTTKIEVQPSGSTLAPVVAVPAVVETTVSNSPTPFVQPQPQPRIEPTYTLAAASAPELTVETTPLGLPTPAPASQPIDPEFAALSAHFSLMQEFLVSQERVVSTLMGEPFVEAWGEATTEAIAAPPVPGQTTPWPLLGEILEWDDQHLIGQRHFDLNEDIFLFDHTLGGPISTRQPELIPLPVIPFTVSMETLAEAAAFLVGGGKQVISMFNLRGYRWLALDHGTLTLGIEAQLQPQTQDQTWEVYVRLTQNGPDNTATTVFEGTVRLAETFPVAPEPLPFHLEQPSPSWLTDENLYRTGMFHGPRFQGVKHIHCWGVEGIEADLQVIPINDFFRHLPQPIFQVDAGLLDAAGQLVGYWIAEQYGVGFNVFPFQVRAFHQYEPILEPGSLVLGRGLMGFISDRFTEAVFDFLDASGRVVARLEGWQDRYFEIPECYRRCRLEPATAFLSEPWPQPGMGSICRRIEPFPENFLEDSWGIWGRVLANLVLNQAERYYWYSLPEKSSARREWLLDQVAVKDVLRQWAQETYGLQLAPADIQILPTASGQLMIDCPELSAFGPLPAVSISHDRGAVIASL